MLQSKLEQCINTQAFKECYRLQFINVPQTILVVIQEDEGWYDDNERIGDHHAFYKCDALPYTPTHNVYIDILQWFKRGHDQLPLYQMCFRKIML